MITNKNGWPSEEFPHNPGLAIMAVTFSGCTYTATLRDAFKCHWKFLTKTNIIESTTTSLDHSYLIKHWEIKKFIFCSIKSRRRKTFLWENFFLIQYFSTSNRIPILNQESWILFRGPKEFQNILREKINILITKYCKKCWSNWSELLILLVNSSMTISEYSKTWRKWCARNDINFSIPNQIFKKLHIQNIFGALWDFLTELHSWQDVIQVCFSCYQSCSNRIDSRTKVQWTVLIYNKNENKIFHLSKNITSSRAVTFSYGDMVVVIRYGVKQSKVNCNTHEAEE